MKESRTLHVGIASLDENIQRTIAIASGKHKRTPDEPRVWFTSIESLAKVLSYKNQLLLEMIRNSQPQSVAELAELSGRAKPNLTRTLKHMEQLGLIELKVGPGGRKEPMVTYDTIRLPELLIKHPPAKAA